MDADMHTLHVLTGLMYLLKLVLIIVNRSQRDIEADKNLSDALGSEAESFRSRSIGASYSRTARPHDAPGHPYHIPNFDWPELCLEQPTQS